jgi:sterol desaturase/sphingolipid hydroxylase (fatty acid hydroxylase superfamily)
MLARVPRLVRLAQGPVNYWAGFAIDLVGTCALMTLALRTWTATWWMGVGLVVVAVQLYQGIEYALHRFGGHGRWRPMVEGHAAHHRRPADPVAMPCFVYPCVVGVLWCVARAWLPLAEASLGVGTVYGMACYGGIVHHLQHHGRCRRYFLRRYHLGHHRNPTLHFGQTTVLWDWVFGTYRCAPVSRRDRGAPAPRRP